jgi:hypothetical protein
MEQVGLELNKIALALSPLRWWFDIVGLCKNKHSPLCKVCNNTESKRIRDNSFPRYERDLFLKKKVLMTLMIFNA